MHIRALVVNFDHFGGVRIIIDSHTPIANHCQTTNLAGMKPAYMDMGRHAVRKVQVDVGNIVNAGLNMCMRLHRNMLWLFAKQIEQDRDIVRGEIPNHIDIVAKQAKIDPLALDMVNFAQVPTLYQLSKFIHRRTVLKGVSNHKNSLLLCRQSNQFLRLRDAGCERLLNENMFAMQQGFFRQSVMRAYRSSDDDSIDIRLKDLFHLSGFS